VENFLNSPKYDELMNELKEGLGAAPAEAVAEPAAEDNEYTDVSKIIFACDAGMGSSAMGASILKNKVKKAGLDVAVSNTSISNLPDDADVVITHKDLTDRAKTKLPGAKHISVENFLNSPKYDELMSKLESAKK
jgi:PTS system mannitol-specific IIC component